IVVIDGKEAFTGGINVGYEYTGLKPNVGFWRDTHVRIAGEVADDLQAVFESHWKIASPERSKARRRWNTKVKHTRKPIQDPSNLSQNATAPGRSVLSGSSAEWGAELGTMESTSIDTVQNTEALHKAYVQTLEGNPGIPTQVIREAYFICLTQATKTIDITTPYFVPDAD
ncbi:cardiolipin synthase, partial [Microbacteriaceae bacterium K1510]|nr:cardiolipin synthase [Microbacteriaceae bacterium K1510]